MKKIEKFKLTTLSKNDLEARQMKELKGGGYCDDGGGGIGIRCNCGTISPPDDSATDTWDRV